MTAAEFQIPDYQHPEPGDPAALEPLFTALHHFRERVDEEIGYRLDADPTAETACELLFDLREFGRRWGELVAAVEATAAQRMWTKTLEWPGWVADRKGGLDRRQWRHPEVAWAVLADLTVDGNGEINPFLVHTVAACRDRFLACATPAWKVTALRELGFDPSDYCETTAGRRTVQVRKAVEDTP